MRAVNETKGPLDKVSGIHKYWARKPWRVLDELILENTKPGDLVMDPFVGSGSVGLQAILSERNFVGFDLNPTAIAITKQTLEIEFDRNEFVNDFRRIEELVKTRIMNLYKCGSRYSLWSCTRDDGSIFGCTSDFDLKTKETSTIVFDFEGNSSYESLPIPDADFPQAFYKDRFSYKGITKVSEMFTPRNLKGLAILKQAIENSNLTNLMAFQLALSNTLLHASRLKGRNIRPLGVNNYWIPGDQIEENVWWRFTDRLKKLYEAKTAIQTELENRGTSLGKHQVKIADATDLRNLQNASVDYVLTDPPYGDAIQYSELSYIWNTWLGDPYIIDREIIVNPKQNKDSNTYMDLMRESLSEIKRVLKPGKRLTIAFHSANFQLWIKLSEALGDLGFELLKIKTQQPNGNPFTRNWAKFSPKTDFYLTLANNNQVINRCSIQFDRAFELLRLSIQKSDSVSIQYDNLIEGITKAILVDGWRITDIPKATGMKKILADFFD